MLGIQLDDSSVNDENDGATVTERSSSYGVLPSASYFATEKAEHTKEKLLRQQHHRSETLSMHFLMSSAEA